MENRQSGPLDTWRFERPHPRAMQLDTAILIYRLEPSRLYSISDMAAIVATRGSRRHRLMTSRLQSFINNHEIPADRGSCQWRGVSIQNYLSPQNGMRAALTLRILVLLAAHGGQRLSGARTKAFHQFIQIFWQRFRLPKWNYLKWTALCFLFAVFLMGAGSVATTYYLNPQIFTILRKEGILAALDSFRDVPRDPESIFQRAWLEYRDNRFADARSSVYMLLHDDPSLELRGRCYYILGAIDLATGHSAGALQHFSLAYSIFDQKNLHSNLHRTAVFLARAYMQLDQLEKAEEMLSLAWQHYEDDRDQQGRITHLATYYAEVTRFNFRSGHLDGALKSAHQGVAAAEQTGAKDDIAEAWSNLGMAYLLQGNRRKGLLYTTRAQFLIFELGDQRRSVFNMINFVLLERIEGQVDEVLLEAVNRWIAAHNDHDLRIQLNLALTIDLGDER